MNKLIQLQCEDYLDSYCDAKDGENIDISINVGDVKINVSIASMKK